MSRATVFAPATIGNVGPGFDVLGLAIDGLGDKITVELVEGQSRIASVTGRDAADIPRDPAKNCAAIAALAMLKTLGINRSVSISIERRLPLSGGLGGSAAASVGGALAAVHASGKNVATPLILAAALKGEAAVAGRHLDNLAPCLLGGITFVLNTEKLDVVKLPVKGEWWISVVTPAQRLSTAVARGVLPREVPRDLMVQQMSQTTGVVAAFATGNHELMRRSLIDHFAEPRRSPLIERFGDAKTAALASGALGCSISGAGPTCFALSSDSKTADKVVRAMIDAFGSGASGSAHQLSPEGARTA